MFALGRLLLNLCCHSHEAINQVSYVSSPFCFVFVACREAFLPCRKAMEFVGRAYSSDLRKFLTFLLRAPKNPTQAPTAAAAQALIAHRINEQLQIAYAYVLTFELCRFLSLSSFVFLSPFCFSVISTTKSPNYRRKSTMVDTLLFLCCHFFIWSFFLLLFPIRRPPRSFARQIGDG
jgi:hypothetical protein